MRCSKAATEGGCMMDCADKRNAQPSSTDWMYRKSNSIWRDPSSVSLFRAAAILASCPESVSVTSGVRGLGGGPA
jgi:hypothetical protein